MTLAPEHRARRERLERLEPLVRAHGGGDLIAHAALQPGLEVFETSYGFVAYRRAFGACAALGAPVCARGDRAAIARRFADFAKRPIFYYLRRDAAEALGEALELHVAPIGVDRAADPERLVAAPGREVRGALAKARRAKLRLVEASALEIAAARPELERINARYLAHAQCPREIVFLNCPVTFDALDALDPRGGQRVFLLFKDDAESTGLFGFAVLNPIYEAGRISAYLLDALRFAPTRLWGVWPAVVHALAARLASPRGRIERGAARGAEAPVGLSLGFCPLHKVGDIARPLGASRVLTAQMVALSELVSSAQYVRRLRELKTLVPGSDEPRYLASFSRSAPLALAVLLEAVGVGLRALAGPDLFRVLGRGLGVLPPQPVAQSPHAANRSLA